MPSNIADYILTDSGWELKIVAQRNSGRLQLNKCKYDYKKQSRVCMIEGCTNSINITRTSGLCDEHSSHMTDLFLTIKAPGSDESEKPPAHFEIIDQLIAWAKPRNYFLNNFFSDMSYYIQGNIPDVTTLDGDVIHDGFIVPSLKDLFNPLIQVVDNHFPSSNNSSYQLLQTRKYKIPARFLALTFAGLLLCEEANRGNRWFCRIIMQDESKTTEKGAGMPLMYYAAKSFEWKVDMYNTLRNIR